ncbi:uridine kinase [Nocardioides zeae]|uniref:Uridine kinase n=1 Tax=Nocardioides zeae TaxID=1457234 RepID=A0ACC6IN05_9ACTN|nr:4-amino-4-deoxy-L-arabinose transferase [Nocardioides zeae]MDR6176046.1 uridine kinase [Nocardioides zeae]MDR6212096.1 uridine kinase [Nocardioides zeae]
MARARPSAELPPAEALPAGTLEVLLRLVARSPARLGAGRLVCVDGPSGSGKTTAAAALARALAGAGHAVVELHMDDQYDGWDGLGAAPGRVARDVVEPLADGRAGRYRRYDWHAGAFAEEHEVAAVGPRGVLVLEGVGSGAAPLAPYRSLLVWVEAPAALRLRRGIERDGEAAAEHLRAWSRTETVHFGAHGTRTAADLRLDAHGRVTG